MTIAAADEFGGLQTTVADHLKLFRDHAEIRFEGRIHEQVLPSIRRLGGEVARSDVFVVHSGADYSPAGRKQERDLLQLDLKEATGEFLLPLQSRHDAGR